MQEASERMTLDDRAWQRAGAEPAQRTFTYDPTQLKTGYTPSTGAGTGAAPHIKLRKEA